MDSEIESKPLSGFPFLFKIQWFLMILKDLKLDGAVIKSSINMDRKHSNPFTKSCKRRIGHRNFLNKTHLFFFP